MTHGSDLSPPCYLPLITMLSRSTRQNIAAPDAYSFPLGFKPFAKLAGVALFAFDQMA
jgi:hypothetical protein